MPETDRLLAISVGNSRTKHGLFQSAALEELGAAPNSDFEAVAQQLTDMARKVENPVIVMASVNDQTADRLQAALESRLGSEVVRIGRDLPIPILHNLDDASTLGQDRLLNALGAYSRAKSACVVIDCGTAVTVDFVDGEGTFCGGIIAPGLRMMLTALHEHTAALPRIDYERPDPSRGPFGKDTRHAMVLGATRAVQGLVHHTIDCYADFYGAYPTIVATGGDAPALFENDELVEHIVPGLQLMGIYEAFRRAGEDDEES